jgi:hypothetical protein
MRRAEAMSGPTRRHGRRACSPVRFSAVGEAPTRVNIAHLRLFTVARAAVSSSCHTPETTSEIVDHAKCSTSFRRRAVFCRPLGVTRCERARTARMAEHVAHCPAANLHEASGTEIRS